LFADLLLLLPQLFDGFSAIEFSGGFQHRDCLPGELAGTVSPVVSDFVDEAYDLRGNCHGTILSVVYVGVKGGQI